MLSYARTPIKTNHKDYKHFENPDLYYPLHKLEINIDKPFIYKDRQSKNGKHVSERTYWEEYYEDPDFKYEFNNGILEEKEMPTSLIDLISQWLENLLYYYLKHNSIARTVRNELGFKLILNNKTSIRKPDYAVILNSNPDQLKDEDRSYKGIYDMCFEYLSETKNEYIKRDTVDKKKEYSAVKVKEYYIIAKNKKNSVFYRLVKKKNNYIYTDIQPQNGIISSLVLPGFQFRIDDLYKRPNIEELYKDEVYKSFVKVDYQIQCAKTELERKSKEMAIANAEQERKAKKQALVKAEQERKAKEKEKKAKKQALVKVEQERKAKEKEKKAKKQALVKAEQERKAKKQALVKAGQERKAKKQALVKAEQERKAKKQALVKAGQEKKAKDDALVKAEQERKEKEQALVKAEQERHEKEQALKEIKRLKKMYKIKSV